MPGPVIRPAEKRDLAQVGELAGALVRMHHAVDPARFLRMDDVAKGYASWLSRELDRKGAVVLVAESAGRIVGYAYGSVEERDWNRLLDEHGVIHDLFVAEGARGAGLGRALVEAIVDALTRLGAPRVVLSTMVGNKAAQRLFRHCGFRPTMLEMTR